MTMQSFADFVGRGQQNLYRERPQDAIRRLLAEVQAGGKRAEAALRTLRSMPGGPQALQAVSAPAPAPAPARPQTAQPVVTATPSDWDVAMGKITESQRSQTSPDIMADLERSGAEREQYGSIPEKDDYQNFINHELLEQSLVERGMSPEDAHTRATEQFGEGIDIQALARADELKELFGADFDVDRFSRDHLFRRQMVDTLPPAPTPAPVPVALAPAPARPRPQTAQATQAVDVQRPVPPRSTNIIGQTIGRGIGPPARALGRGAGAIGRAHLEMGEPILKGLAAAGRFGAGHVVSDASDIVHGLERLRGTPFEDQFPGLLNDSQLEWLRKFEAARIAQREIDRTGGFIEKAGRRLNPFQTTEARALSDPELRESAHQFPVYLPFVNQDSLDPAFHLSALDVAEGAFEPLNIIGVGAGTKVAKELRQLVPYLGTLQKPGRRPVGQVLQETGQSITEEFAPVTRKAGEAARATGREALRQAERMPGGLPGVARFADEPIVPSRGAGGVGGTLDEFYPLAGDTVDGRTTSTKVDNFDSVRSSYLSFEEIPGIREMDLRSWGAEGGFVAADDIRHVDELAKAIRESNHIDPVIIGVGKDGEPVVIEGAHRVAAMQKLGANSIPVKLVVDTTDASLDEVATAIRGTEEAWKGRTAFVDPPTTPATRQAAPARAAVPPVRGVEPGAQRIIATREELEAAEQVAPKPGVAVTTPSGRVLPAWQTEGGAYLRVMENVGTEVQPVIRPRTARVVETTPEGIIRAESTEGRVFEVNPAQTEIEQATRTEIETFNRQRGVDTAPPVRPPKKAATGIHRPGMAPAQIAETAKEDAAKKIVPSPDAGGGGSIDELTSALAGLPEEDAAKALDNTYDSTKLDVSQLGLGEESRMFGLEETVDLGLSRIERLASSLAGLVRAKGLVHVDVVDALWNLRTRVINNAEKLAASQALRIAPKVKRAFKPDKNGQIQSLINIDASLRGAAPTIQDVAARLPRFLPHLNREQIQALEELRKITAPHKKVLEESGRELGLRPDIIDGGFYVPRGNIQLDDLDSGTIVVKRLGVPQSQVKAAEHPSMAEAILNGSEYSTFPKAIDALVKSTGQTVGDNFFAAAMRAIRNEDGIRIGRTAKELVIEESPEVFQQMAKLRAASTRLKGLVKQKNQKALKEMDRFIEDPGIDDIDQLVTLFGKKRTVLRGTLKGAELNKAEEALEILLAELKAYKSVYDYEMQTIAKRLGRKEIGGEEQFPRLHGVSFADIFANRANDLINKEVAVTVKDKAQYAKEALQGTNGIMRATTATADNSAMGIQLLITGYDSPKVWHKASVKSLKAWGGEGVYASWATEFNDAAKARGTFTTDEWAGRFGLHQSGKPIDVSSDILEAGFNIPGVRKPVGGFFQAASRAFSVAGDVARIERAQELLLEELAKGRTIDELIQAGDLRRMANHVNASSGFVNGRFALGNWIFYSTKFLFARMLTVARAMKGMDLDAPLDMVPIVGNKLRGRVPKINKFATMQDRYARRAVLRVLGWGTILTVLANESRGEETDFRLYIKNREGKLYVNPNFVKIRNLGGRDRSVFGPLHGLLNLVASAAITPKTGEIASLAKRAINAPGASLMLDFARNKKFDGTPIYNPKASLGYKAGQVMGHVATNMRPFALDESMEYIGPGFNDFKEGDIVSGGISVLDMLGESYGAYSTPLSNSELRDLLDMEEDMDPQMRHELYMILDSRQSGYEAFIVGEDFAPRYKKFKNDVYKKFGKPFGDLDTLAKSQLEKDPVLGPQYREFDLIRSRAMRDVEGFEDKGARSRTERRRIQSDAQSQARAVLGRDIFDLIDTLGHPRLGRYVDEDGGKISIRSRLFEFVDTVSDINNTAEGRKYQLQRDLGFDLPFVHDPKSEFDKILNVWYSVYRKHEVVIPLRDERVPSTPWRGEQLEGSLDWDAIKAEHKAIYNSLTVPQQKQLNDYLARNDDELVYRIKQLAFDKPPDFQKTEVTNIVLFQKINVLRNQYQASQPKIERPLVVPSVPEIPERWWEQAE